jgi:hypothetical protein
MQGRVCGVHAAGGCCRVRGRQLAGAPSERREAPAGRDGPGRAPSVKRASVQPCCWPSRATCGSGASSAHCCEGSARAASAVPRCSGPAQQAPPGPWLPLAPAPAHLQHLVYRHVCPPSFGGRQRKGAVAARVPALGVVVSWHQDGCRVGCCCCCWRAGQRAGAGGRKQGPRRAAGQCAGPPASQPPAGPGHRPGHRPGHAHTCTGASGG